MVRGIEAFGAALTVLAALSPSAAGGSPAFPQEAKLVGSDSTFGDYYGLSTAISGDTAVIGAPSADHAGGFDAGAAYVFVRSGTTWIQQAKLTASNAAIFSSFGYSVSISGDTVLVGAPAADHAGALAAGLAYVFVRSGSTWTEQAKLNASDSAALARFGGSVSLSGDTAIIGATGSNTGGVDSGAAYVFVRSGTTWTQQAKLTSADVAGGDLFGFAVSVSGDTALIGAPEDDHAKGTDAGSAYVFARNGTTWSEAAKLIGADTHPSDRLGVSVSVSGGTALVGAHMFTLGGNKAGAAYVFVANGTTWPQQAKLVPSDAAAGDHVGYAVSVWNDVAIVGSGTDDHGSLTDVGSAYAFMRSGTTWTEVAKLIASDADNYDHFGVAVAISDGRAIVGSEQDDFIGSAYVFRVGSCGAVDHYGVGCSGSGGFVPALAIVGCAEPNDSVTVSVTKALGGSTALLLFGGGQGNVPIGGGCSLLLNPLLAPQLIVPLGGTGPGNGLAVLPGVLPAAAAGITFSMQAAVLDAASAPGFSLTNGVLVKVAP